VKFPKRSLTVNESDLFVLALEELVLAVEELVVVDEDCVEVAVVEEELCELEEVEEEVVGEVLVSTRYPPTPAMITTTTTITTIAMAEIAVLALFWLMFFIKGTVKPFLFGLKNMLSDLLRL